jgi:hypothetical protein
VLGLRDDVEQSMTKLDLRHDEGSVALSLCTSAHPIYTRFANIFGASISEPTMRPNPRHEGGGKAAKDPGLLLVRTQQLAIVGSYLQVRPCWAAVRLEVSGPPSRKRLALYFQTHKRIVWVIETGRKTK